MRLHDLINDRQPQARAALEAGLQRLENLFALFWIEARAGVAKANAHQERRGLEADRQRAATGHGAKRVVAQIPENLLDTIGVHAGAHRLRAKFLFDTVLTVEYGMLRQQSQRLVQDA